MAAFRRRQRRFVAAMRRPAHRVHSIPTSLQETAMERFALLLERHPLVFFHMLCALCALALGIVILTRRKGTGSHRALGWTWVLLMASVALTSAFIRDYRLPNLMGYTPIHLLTVLTAVLLPLAVWHARRGNVAAHRKSMKSLYAGGCVVAGMFTLVPGRFLGDLLWKQALGVLG
jgi:uncharacterized membrane protein